jgi:hopanoid biosynthesis associated RND transporter like protein HpnN
MRARPPSRLLHRFQPIFDFGLRQAWAVIIAAIALAAVAGVYVVQQFAINTNVESLISSDLPWRQHELAYQTAFPQNNQLIFAVVDAPTPELANAAAAALSDQLAQEPKLFRSIERLNGGPFFTRNGLLFLATDELAETLSELKGAQSPISILAADPSLRGIVQAFSLSLGAAQMGMFDNLAHTLNGLSDTLESVLAGRATDFSWKALLTGTNGRDQRQLVAIWPELDFSALQPGERATAAIRAAGERAHADFHSRLRLTGPVPIADEEFATLQKNAGLNGLITTVLVVLILWLALRSMKIVLCVAITLAVGLALAAALGLLMVGAFNPISLAFAVLFIGLGADFSIQFSVRYRAERHLNPDLRGALVDAARRIAAPLTLAAAAAAAGFMSFLPTHYAGMAELGLIAGCGMGIAYVASMLVLPALIQVVRPPGEPEPLGYAALARVDRFLAGHRYAVIAATTAIALAGLPLLSHLRFDFDPLNLRDPSEEAIATYHELSRDPLLNPHTIEVLTPSPEAAAAVAHRLAHLPLVGEIRTIDSFVPSDQAQKAALIAKTARELDEALDPPPMSSPSDADNIAALQTGRSNLMLVADAGAGADADAAKRLADDLSKLIAAPATVRMTAQTALTQPLAIDLAELRLALHPQLITRSNLPEPIRASWVTQDGRARVEVAPKADMHEEVALRQFAQALRALEPTATGAALEALEWGNTIIDAFILAGTCALVSIAMLLWVVLRRIGDVLLTLVPLLVAALVTLEICALFDFPLNYANIIALPLLLGVGVAFKIYYVMAWRAGETAFLQSPLTRAVFFSALMTAVAFGSLSFSSHPGTASMGKLLGLSLACTLASAALFQPALMGAPRARSPEIGNRRSATGDRNR